MNSFKGMVGVEEKLKGREMMQELLRENSPGGGRKVK